MFSYAERVQGQVGERVRTLRTEHGWSMRQLADHLGVSAATVNAIEHGRTGVSVDRLADLARAFGVAVGDLLDQPATHTPQRGRRPTARPDQDPALRAAIDAFVAAGYHGSTMRDIAERANMSLANVYHYYPGKQSLLVAILDMTMDDLDARFAAVTAQQTEPLDQLYRMVQALALFHAERADMAYIGASEMRSIEEPERSRIAARRSSIQHALDREITRAIRDGVAACDRPQETGRAIATMCTSLPQWFDAAGPTSPRAVATTYAELALRMIGADHTRPPVATNNEGRKI